MQKQIMSVLRAISGLFLTVGAVVAASVHGDPGVIAIVVALILIANSIDSKGE